MTWMGTLYTLLDEDRHELKHFREAEKAWHEEGEEFKSFDATVRDYQNTFTRGCSGDPIASKGQ